VSDPGGIVPLSLQNRHIGPITVVTCSGRIVEGPELQTLQQHINDLLPILPHIVLDFGQVEFVDSSGLGLLVRFLSRTQQFRGGLKLCAVPPRVTEVLRVTRLLTSFDVRPSADEAILAFWEEPTPEAISDRLRTDVLCVEQSADVLAFVREMLRHAGYGVVTSNNLPDALILLKAMQPKVVVIGAELRAVRNTRTGESFNRLAEARAVVELPPGFSSRDAGEAGQQVLDQVRAAAGDPGLNESVSAAP
jgi:anti-sigma B factor antagonist